MDTRVFCVFNVARRVFLSSKVTVADGASQPLKVLKVMVSGLALDAESGLWLTPISSTPAVPRLFPFDIAYLDADHRVLETVEMLPGVDFPAHRREFASAVVLSLNTLRFTQTRRGDQLIVCLQDEASELVSATDANRVTSAAGADRRPEKPVWSPAERAMSAEALPLAAAPAHSSAALDPIPSMVGATAVESGGILVEERPSVEGLAPAEQATGEAAASVSEPKIATGEAEGNLQIAEPPNPAKPQSMSITEVVIEKPQISSSQPIGGHPGVEDLFANWVESPSAPPSWIAQKANANLGNPSAAPTNEEVSVPGPAPTPAPIPAPILEPPVRAGESQETRSFAIETANDAKAGVPAPETLAAQAEKTDPASMQRDVPEAKQTPPAVCEPDSSKNGVVSKAPVESPMRAAVPVAVSRSAPAHTFTVAQYGMWQVSTPGTISLGTPAKPAVAEATAKPDPKPSGNHAVAPEKAKAEQTSTKMPERPSNRDPQVALDSPAPTLEDRNDPALPGKTQGNGSQPAGTAVETELPKAQKSAAGPLPETGRADEIARAAAPSPKRERAFAMGVSDWRTHRIVEATGKPVSPEFARAVQDKLEKLQSRGSAPQPSKPAEKPEVVLERKLEAALEKKSEAALLEKTETAPANKPEGSTEKRPVFAKTAPPSQAAPDPTPALAAAPDQKESAASGQDELAITLPLPSFLKPQPDQKGKLKISLQRVGANAKNGKQEDSLGAKFKRWLNPSPVANSDRRRAHRRYVPGMVAHYYTGGAPKPNEVADISMTGFYVLTEDRWMPGTMIQMTLQKPCSKGERKQSITVLSRVVRRGSDGVAAEFVMGESLDPNSRDLLPTQTTDRFALARFI